MSRIWSIVKPCVLTLSEINLLNDICYRIIVVVVVVVVIVVVVVVVVVVGVVVVR